jgi:hypothetical protein
MFHNLGYRELHFYQQRIQALEAEDKPAWLKVCDWVIQNNQFILKFCLLSRFCS